MVIDREEADVMGMAEEIAFRVYGDRGSGSAGGEEEGGRKGC